MRQRTRIALGTALAATLGFGPASVAQTVPPHIDMTYNPAPVPSAGHTEWIDLMFPQAFGAKPAVAMFVRMSPPTCTIPSSACESSFTRVALGQTSAYSYLASSEQEVWFFFKATAPAGTAYSDLGHIVVSASNQALPTTVNPIMFVTQVPIASDYLTVNSAFGSHLGNASKSGRGGDLYIRYADGTLKNLTKLAKDENGVFGRFGSTGLQGSNSIAVREPSVHWSGTKAVFSMVVGCATNYQNPEPTFRWQLYEVTGLGLTDTPVITKVPRQPESFNNVSPCYGTNGRIIFTSDRPRNGDTFLYPQLDEYESQVTNTGLWSLDPATGDLFLVQHSPSGSFKPFIDSYGRVVFTRWDHLERDQQKSLSLTGDGNYQVFNYPSETSGTYPSPANAGAHDDEVFPEPHPFFVNYVRAHQPWTNDPNGYAANIVGIQFNRFQPWTVRENGTEEETLNHVGRHELAESVSRAFTDDTTLVNHLLAGDARIANEYAIFHMFQVKESGNAAHRGYYLGVDGRESETHAAGQLISLSGQLGKNGDEMVVYELTHKDTRVPTLTPSANHTGMYRNPTELADGQLISVHTDDKGKDGMDTSVPPRAKYHFRLKTLQQAVHADGSTRWKAFRKLTAGPGITKTVQYRDNSGVTSFSGEMWEMDPVEVVARPIPVLPAATLAQPERTALSAAGVRPGDLRTFLRNNDLALIVSRNMTTRDFNDRQQSFNLKVAGSTTDTSPSNNTPREIKYLQLFQADQIRAMFWGNATPIAGRRVLAQPMHDPRAINPTLSGAPQGSVLIAPDGSMAALVPARRAMTWQLTDANGNTVVRERYWVTFQPGEIRVCASCHGANRTDQANHPAPTNTPLALTQMADYLEAIGAVTSPGQTQQASPP